MLLDIGYGVQGRGCYIRACAYAIHHYSFIIHVRTSKPKLVDLAQAGVHASAAFTCVFQDVTPLAFHKIGLMLFYVCITCCNVSVCSVFGKLQNE